MSGFTGPLQKYFDVRCSWCLSRPAGSRPWAMRIRALFSATASSFAWPNSSPRQILLALRCWLVSLLAYFAAVIYRSNKLFSSTGYIKRYKTKRELNLTHTRVRITFTEHIHWRAHTSYTWSAKSDQATSRGVFPWERVSLSYERWRTLPFAILRSLRLWRPPASWGSGFAEGLSSRFGRSIQTQVRTDRPPAKSDGGDSGLKRPGFFQANLIPLQYHPD